MCIRDSIKPANVMLDGQTRVKLMDFGVAKIQDTDRTHRTQVGTMVGTPSYMSPELDRVISRALAKAPEARYQSAADFSRALQRVYEGKPAEEEEDRTIMRAYPGPAPQAPARPPAERTTTQPPLATSTGTATGSQEVEDEFWRSIKDSNDPEDFELYVQQFPRGAYARLAERKIAKLRKDAGTATGSQVSSGAHT